MSENVATQIVTSPDLTVSQTNARKVIITSPRPVLETADVDQESEDSNV